MNFFESQEAAKRNSGKLYLLFALAVVSLIVMTNLLFMFVFGFAATGMSSMAASQTWVFDWNSFLVIGLAVTTVVLFGSLYKVNSLSSGGARVAEMLDGRLLVNGSGSFKERQLLNVVEEMAIASGTPVPPVYLLEEAGINAFAAGYSPNDAVVGISRGALETLTREQLQGVVAHEFSHILHGDMRINIRLIGVLHGILILGIIGQHLMSSSRRSLRSRGQGVQVGLGLGMLAIGYVGVFFGNLIKAAVSRQREYLADASAVQFTRNPEGIAGALMQISQHTSRSYMDHPASSEISHALFEESSPSFFSGLYATHPPLEKRIAAVLPRWDGSFDLLKLTKTTDSPIAKERDANDGAANTAEKLMGTLTAVIATEAMVSQIGNPTNAHITAADQLIENLPTNLVEAAREPASARAVFYLLLLHRSAEVAKQQLDYLQINAEPGVAAELKRLLALAETDKLKERFTLASIAISSLRQLSKKQYQLFKSNVEYLIQIDRKVSLSEWVLQKLLIHHLSPLFSKGAVNKIGKLDLKQSLNHIAIVLSVIAYSSQQKGLSVSQSFAKGQEKLGMNIELVPIDSIGIELLNKALDQLTDLKPLQKPLFLKSCAAVITADGEIATIEAEMLRAVSATIDCPMPPLLQ